MALKNIVALVGGVGGAKLAYGLAQALPPGSLTLIVNTGDDFWWHGLRICPDLDTIMYTLSGVVNRANGWGVADDTRHMLGMMQQYGTEGWFGVGDKDLATDILRTEALRNGEPLTSIMARLSKSLGVLQYILPMCDAPVSTMVDTVEYGEMAFQEYFVRERWQPTMRGLRLDGIEQATISNAASEAIAAADAIIIGPSNPWLSIWPILSVPGMREAMLKRDVPRIAVTPIVGGQAVKGPSAKLMLELGYTPSAETVARYYSDDSLINGFVYDDVDRDLSLGEKRLRTAVFNTVMNSDDHKVTLAQNVLYWLENWN